MVFRVELAPRAFADLDSIAGYIRERESFESAEKWFNAILRAIESLAEMPQRCRVAEESRDLGREVRVLLYGRKNRAYRVFLCHSRDANGPGLSCPPLGAADPG
jgi:plasmid stabilization system protein ParE